ncbi:unnamed protein product, partial [Rotaria sp. Silwood1]
PCPLSLWCRITLDVGAGAGGGGGGDGEFVRLIFPFDVVCGYEDINSIVTDDQHSRTQVLLARHAELVNTIVGTRSSH